MNTPLLKLLSTIALLVIAYIGSVFASSREARPARIVESSHPPYVAKIAGGQLMAITLEPRQLPLDMNAANSIRSETADFKPARYSFPDASVPQSVLSRMSNIYRYDRCRDVPIVSSGGDWVIAEYFRAGSHVPLSRFQLLGKQVQRQELLDASGKAVNVIVVDWAPASARDDEESTDPSALGEHPAWIRVFKVSPSGKKTLIALASRKMRFTTAPDTYDAPKDDDLVFGSPNGQSKWRTKAEFLSANRIELDARSLRGDLHRAAGSRASH
ncbi:MULTISPECIES: hypothetical protein [unclassified Caballeronia]|uniref:hypothetical protein n=1 Tax=unclassified Caballeronia TaxID=2646786 RepID=UPI002860351B|nr:MULTISPECIES: hypothetical protein [unclassified Caballeronia]MDR5736532.1 hypothetical protein [Caballeronia sp. LZ016]MDR5810989.1 hypothetical protein [Caballeronia sp. LZ019]